MRTALVVVLALIAAAGAAIVLNLVLLGYTSTPGEPVGKLSPAVPIKVVQKPVLEAPERGDERDD
jgi:hypothetical protein